MGFGSVGIPVEGDDVGVVDQPVDGGCGDDLVAEHVAPARERQVRGQNDRTGLIA